MYEAIEGASVGEGSDTYAQIAPEPRRRHAPADPAPAPQTDTAHHARYRSRHLASGQGTWRGFLRMMALSTAEKRHVNDTHANPDPCTLYTPMIFYFRLCTTDADS